MAIILDASPRLDRVRVFVWITAAAGVLAATALYVPVVSGLARQWLEDADAAYGMIVAAAAAFAFKARLPQLRRLHPQRSGRERSAIAVVPLVGASVLYLLGTLAADVFLVRISLPVFLASTIWFMAGPAYVKVLAAPLALCAVAIPLPSALVTELTMPLQLIASQCAAAVLGGVGIPVVRSGNVLALGDIRLEVAQACSGMRSIVTLFALVAVYVSVRELPLRRIVILLLATVPIALAGNGLRVAITAMLATRLGESATRGWVHDATGWAAFVLMCAALFAVHGWGQTPQTRRLNLQGRAA